MPEALKDMYFRSDFFEDIIMAMKEVFPDFNGDGFRRTIFDSEWEDRELKNECGIPV